MVDTEFPSNTMISLYIFGSLTYHYISLQLDDKEEDALKEAYCQTFDLIDADGSGTLDKQELTDWMNMCGAELNVEKIIGVLLSDGNTLTRDKFACLMCSSAASCRRDYDIDGSTSGGHH